MPVFDFRDASLKGDRTWSRVSRFTSLAPILVLTLFLLSITQIVLGVVWITSIPQNLTFVQVIQPLIVPALSFFNTIPSLHLHVLARSNKPVMAMVFSALIAVVYYVSAIAFLPGCVTGAGNGGLKGTECPMGSRRDVWVVMVVLQFLSAAGYSLHFVMAAYVRSDVRRRQMNEREGRVLVIVDDVEKAKREEEARKRWRDIGDW